MIKGNQITDDGKTTDGQIKVVKNSQIFCIEILFVKENQD